MQSAMTPSKEEIANLPFARTINCGIHICRLLVAIKQAQKTAITVTLFSLTNFALNQKPWTNMAIITNRAVPEEKPQTRFSLMAADLRLLND